MTSFVMIVRRSLSDFQLVQEVSLKILLFFDPLGRKLKPIYSEAEPFGNKNQPQITCQQNSKTFCNMIIYTDRFSRVFSKSSA